MCEKENACSVAVPERPSTCTRKNALDQGFERISCFGLFVHANSFFFSQPYTTLHKCTDMKMESYSGKRCCRLVHVDCMNPS